MRVQEAMLPYYYGHPIEVLRLVRDAQGFLNDSPRPAGALAAAAEARALARLRSPDEARQALARAEGLATRVSEPDTDEAFRFGARRLLFYASGTFSHLGDVAEATHAQEQALSRYGSTAGLIDPALIRLDQAQVVLADGDSRSVGELVEGAVFSVPPAQRTPIFGMRLRWIIEMAPAGTAVHRTLMELQRQLVIESAEGLDAAR